MLVIELVNSYQSTVRVIHYDGSSTTVTEEVLGLTSVEVAVYKGLTYSPGVAIRRARSRLHKKLDYNVFYRNCESFVNWALINQEITLQGQFAALMTILSILVIAFFCFIFHPYYTMTITPTTFTSFYPQT